MRLILRLNSQGRPRRPRTTPRAGGCCVDLPPAAAPDLTRQSGRRWNTLTDRHDSFECESCQGRSFRKRRRSLLERLRWSSIYVCRDCGFELRLPTWNLHWSSLTVPHCSRCGNRRLSKFRYEDPIERLSSSPLSMFCKQLGAPILYCFRCRTQFYDFRAPKPHPPAGTEATHTKTGLGAG